MMNSYAMVILYYLINYYKINIKQYYAYLSISKINHNCYEIVTKVLQFNIREYILTFKYRSFVLPAFDLIKFQCVQKGFTILNE